MKSEISDDKTVGLAEYLEGKPRALMVSEVAALLSVSERQIYKLAAENRIPHLRIAGSIRFDPLALAGWLRREIVSQRDFAGRTQTADARVRCAK